MGGAKQKLENKTHSRLPRADKPIPRDEADIMNDDRRSIDGLINPRRGRSVYFCTEEPVFPFRTGREAGTPKTDSLSHVCDIICVSPERDAPNHSDIQEGFRGKIPWRTRRRTTTQGGMDGPCYLAVAIIQDRRGGGTTGCIPATKTARSRLHQHRTRDTARRACLVTVTRLGTVTHVGRAGPLFSTLGNRVRPSHLLQ